VLRPDGSVLQTPGYDAGTGLLYQPSADFAIVADLPSRDDAVASTKALVAIVADFPFASSADRSAWFAGLLTTFARPAIRGNTPLLVYDASVRGSGKGKLIDTIAVLATGRRLSTTTLPSAEEETRKKITTLIIEGKPAIHWDNIAEPIGGDTIESLATSPTWQDRVLGKNASIELPAKVINFFSGNNVRYKGDTARRVLPVRLVPKVERPEDRTDFAHRDLLAWVLEHRTAFVGHALTILRAWFVAGKPSTAETTFGSFEEWHDLIVNVTTWAGLPTPMTVRDGLEDRNDPARVALAHIVESWQGAFGQKPTTARAIFDTLSLGALEELRGSFATLIGNDNLTSRLIGECLSACKERVVSARSIRSAGVSRGVATWYCEKAG